MAVADQVISESATHQAPGRFFRLRVPVVVTLGAIGAVHGPLVALHVWGWFGRTLAWFAPIVLVGALLLARRGARGFDSFAPGASAWPLALTTLVSAASGFLIAPELAVVAAWLAALGVVYARGGVPLVRAALPAWCFLGWLVPSPGLVDRWGGRVTTLMSQWAGAVLDTHDVVHLVTPSAILVLRQSFPFSALCGGPTLWLPLLAVVVFGAFWARRSVPHVVFLGGATIFWLLVGTTAHATILPLAQAQWGWNTIDGWQAWAISIALLAVGLGVVVSTDQVLIVSVGLCRSAWRGAVRAFQRWRRERALQSAYWSNLGAATPEEMYQGEVPVAPVGGMNDGATALPSTSRSPWGNAFILALHLVIAGAGAWWCWPVLASAFTPRESLTSRLRALPNDLPAEKVGALIRGEVRERHRDPSDPRGEYARVWPYKAGNVEMNLAVEFPFRGWPGTLTDPPEGEWVLTERVSGDTGPAGALQMSAWETIADRHALDLAQIINLKGLPITEPISPFRDSRALLTRVMVWRTGVRADLAELYGPSARLRLTLQADRPLGVEEGERAREFFKEYRQRVAQALGGAEVSP